MKQIVASLLLFGANAMAASWTQTTLGSHDGTTRVAMSLDGTTAASTGAKTVKIWNVATGKLLRTWQTEHDGVSLAFTPDGKGLGIRNERGVDLLDVSTGQILRTFNVPTGGVPRVAISRDGRWVAAGASDHKARVWDLASGKLMHELPHQYHLVFGVHFTADSKAIATGSGDGVATHGEVKLWDLETGAMRWAYEAKQIWMVSALPDHSAIVSIDVGGSVVLHDFVTGKAKQNLATGDQCRAIAISQDGKRLAATARNEIVLWELSANELQASSTKLTGHGNWVLALAFSPDAAVLISGGSDKTVRLWRLKPSG